MSRKQLLSVAACILILVVAQLACARDGDFSYSTNVSNWSRTGTTTDGNGTETEVIEIGPEITSADFSVDIKVNSGFFSWELVDPNGETQWEGSLTEESGRFKESQSFTPIAGEWTLSFTQEEFAGSYSFNWKGR